MKTQTIVLAPDRYAAHYESFVADVQLHSGPRARSARRDTVDQPTSSAGISRAAACWLVLTFIAGFVAGSVALPPADLLAAPGDHVFELRTYTAPPGKLEALKSRFRDHTIRIFGKHNMKSIGYWIPQDAPLSGNTIIYVLEHPSREAAKANWAAFGKDPEWVKAKAESEKDGPLVTKAPDSIFLDPADFSAIR